MSVLHTVRTRLTPKADKPPAPHADDARPPTPRQGFVTMAQIAEIEALLKAQSA